MCYHLSKYPDIIKIGRGYRERPSSTSQKATIIAATRLTNITNDIRIIETAPSKSIFEFEIQIEIDIVLPYKAGLEVSCV